MRRVTKHSNSCFYLANYATASPHNSIFAYLAMGKHCRPCMQSSSRAYFHKASTKHTILQNCMTTNLCVMAKCYIWMTEHKITNYNICRNT